MDFGKFENAIKGFQIVISNDPGFQPYTLNQVIDEQPGITFPCLFCKGISSKRSY